MYKTAICHSYYRKNGNCVGDQHAQKLILISEEVTQGWKKLHNVELHNLYSSLNITSENEIGKVNDRLKIDNTFSENLKENHLKNIHLDVSTIFKYSFQQTQDKFVQ
jgi:hypothetical protein